MAKVFRKFRLKEFRNNKFSKYILYSIGEILLIVLGILIALQVSNHNEKNKNRDKEQKYLSAIKKELEDNLSRVNGAQENIMKVINAQVTLLEYLSNSSEVLREDSIAALINQSLNVPVEMNIQNGVFTELIYSGGMKDIQNDSIKLMVASWDSRTRSVLIQEEDVRSKIRELLDIILEEGDISTVVGAYITGPIGANVKFEEANNKVILRKQRFKNVLMFNLVVSQNLGQVRYPRLKKQINILLDLVERELQA